jgi:hypothetical protein
MLIYEGRLALVKKTHATVVYGNEVLHGQYVPKKLLTKMGKEFPPELCFTIEIPDSTDGRNRK